MGVQFTDSAAPIYKNIFSQAKQEEPAGPLRGNSCQITPPIPGGVKHKKTLDTDSIHIQRSEAQHRTYCEIPLYKKQNRRYNKNRNVPIIRLRMEAFSPYAGSRCF